MRDIRRNKSEEKYSGPFTSEIRGEFEKKWTAELDDADISHNPECSMRTVLGEPVKIQQWVGILFAIACRCERII